MAARPLQDRPVTTAPAVDGEENTASRVKAVLETMALKNHGPDFTAMVYDDLTAAESEAYQGGAQSKSEMQRRARHLIATYSGRVDPFDGQPSSADNAYTISWFSGAFPDTPKVGKVGEKWKIRTRGRRRI